MAEACVITLDAEKKYKTGFLRKYKFAITADGSGNATNAVTKTEMQLSGWVSRVSIKPGTSTSFDFTLKDGDGFTLASKTGSVAAEDLVAGYHIVESTLEVAVANAGADKTLIGYVTVVSP